MTTRTQQRDARRRVLPFLVSFLAALVAVLATLLSSASASAATQGTAETRVRASASVVEVPVGPPERIAAGQRLGNEPARAVVVLATGVAAKAGTAGADDVLNGVRLRAQLTGQEIAGGHAFEKHILDLGEFPGIRTRAQFASHIEDVVMNGEMRTLGGGRTAFWRHGTVVIRNPRAPDGGTAFQPTDGYDYFLNQLH